MNQILFVVHMPISAVGTEARADLKTTNWSQFEPQVTAMQLPPAKTQRISRNVWLLDAEVSASAHDSLRAFAAYFYLQSSSFAVSVPLTPMQEAVTWENF